MGIKRKGWHVSQGAIVQCRTAALGGHLYACESCAVITERYNLCRNRHCPKCQGLDKLQWLHPHLHCIVPGGGLSPEGDRWIASSGDFFLPIRALGRLLRGKFLDGVRKKVEREELALPDELRATADYRRWLDELYAREWNVYCKPPFGGSEKALGYLARYTHRVAIDNRRLESLEDDHVVFRYKDRAAGNETRTTRLEVLEFLRRFLQHVLPSGFQRIRYSGLWANRVRAENLERCRLLLGVAAETPCVVDQEDGDDQESWAAKVERLTGVDPLECPVCRQGRLVYLAAVWRPKPPAEGLVIRLWRLCDDVSLHSYDPQRPLQESG